LWLLRYDEATGQLHDVGTISAQASCHPNSRSRARRA
jgi:hypothetical protein